MHKILKKQISESFNLVCSSSAFHFPTKLIYPKTFASTIANINIEIISMKKMYTENTDLR